MGKIRQYSLIDIYCSDLRSELLSIDNRGNNSQYFAKNCLSKEDLEEFTEYYEHFCLKGTDWYMLYTPQYIGKEKLLDIDYLSIDANSITLDKMIEIRRAFEELFLTYDDATFTAEYMQSSCKLLEWAADKGLVKILEKNESFDSSTYTFKPSKTFLDSIKNKTCTVIQKPNLDLLCKESTMNLP